MEGGEIAVNTNPYRCNRANSRRYKTPVCAYASLARPELTGADNQSVAVYPQNKIQICAQNSSFHSSSLPYFSTTRSRVSLV
jgi:hypothetical protein